MTLAPELTLLHFHRWKIGLVLMKAERSKTCGTKDCYVISVENPQTISGSTSLFRNVVVA